MSRVRLRTVLAAVGASALLLAACNGADEDPTTTEAETDPGEVGEAPAEADGGEEPPAADGEPIRVGIITSTSGPGVWR